MSSKNKKIFSGFSSLRGFTASVRSLLFSPASACFVLALHACDDKPAANKNADTPPTTPQTYSPTPLPTPTIIGSSASPLPAPVIDDDEANFTELLNPPMLKECHDKAKVYDRRGDGSCHVAAYPADFECTEAGVLAAFGGGTKVQEMIAKNKTDGFTIDQCGYTADKRFSFWIKKYKDGDAYVVTFRENSIAK